MTSKPNTRTIINDVLDDFAEQGYSIKSIAYDSGTVNIYGKDEAAIYVPSHKAQMSIVLVRSPLMRDAKPIAMQDDDE